MLLFSSTLKSSPLVVIAALTFSSAALSAPLNLNYTATSPDGTSITNTVVNSTINIPAANSVSTYTNTYGSLAYTLPGSISASNPTGSEFYDDYVFTIDASSLSSITATIDLGSVFDINNLNVRLFSWNGNAESNSTPTVTIGAPVGGVLQAWTYATGTGDVAVINQTNVTAGTYVLQVRGNTDGSNGGTYVGQLQVTPVPLPAALPLLLSGLGLLGLMGKRRAA
ncbi:MAG: FxDxF family PEP-CTERM protein [Steroidobacteraceae bacterium]